MVRSAVVNCGELVCACTPSDPCCTTEPDPHCIAANRACEAARTPAHAAITAAEGDVNRARLSLESAEVALTIAQGVADASSHSLDAANEALAAVQAAHKVGTEAAGKIAIFGINHLISIHEISLDVSLRTANGGTFPGFVRANFLGEAEVTERLTIHLRDITVMAKQVAHGIGDGFSSLF